MRSILWKKILSTQYIIVNYEHKDVQHISRTYSSSNTVSSRHLTNLNHSKPTTFGGTSVHF